MPNALHLGLSRYLSERQLALLRASKIGIAGLGGLGSNACLMLARTGLEHFLLIDFDVVEASNLNRQAYLPKDLGLPKVIALQKLLLSLNPDLQVETKQLKLTAENLPKLLPSCPIWLEALDQAETKAMFVNSCLEQGLMVVSASGLAGFGGANFTRRTLGPLTVVGDLTTDIDTSPPLAPRVTWASAMMADRVLELILAEKKS
ncbi:MAG: sulfur carrier protein ThiS adenylyltransferase ThiF [Desulfovibrio sp.]|nr:sulfur carrier protein ThiS adenylyltransferase ThiF [Desulfovibrio sp.]